MWLRDIVPGWGKSMNKKQKEFKFEPGMFRRGLDDDG